MCATTHGAGWISDSSEQQCERECGEALHGKIVRLFWVSRVDSGAACAPRAGSTGRQRLPRIDGKEGMAMADNREVLEAAYAHFNARELDAVLALMHRQVDWPNGMEGGRVLGHDGVREYWTRQWGMIDPHVEPVGFVMEADGRIAVSVHQTVMDLSGKVLLDQMVEHVYRVEDGLIREMEIREPVRH